MAAVHEVMNTYELVEMIIVQVQPHQIRELKQVSKSWSKIIKRSNAIARARVVDCALDRMSTFETPRSWNGLDYIDLKDEVCFFLYNLYQADCCAYTTEDWLRLNPVIGQVDARRPPHDLPGWKLTFELEQLQEHDPEIQDRLDEYVTEPPCSSITLETGYWVNSWGWSGPAYDYHNTCWSYRKNGLRLRDLLQARDGLKQAQQGYLSDEELTIAMATVMVLPMQDGDEPSVRGTTALWGDGPLPRFRRASHIMGPEREAMEEKDRAYVWTGGVTV